MPAVDPKSGSCYIWMITTFLFVCIAGGGALLAIYITDPDSSSWYPIAGISLVCLPWLFWFLTFLYRLLSRRFGFRMVCWGASVDASLPQTSSSTNAAVAGSAAAGGDNNNQRELESGTAGGSPTTRDSSPARLSNESQAPLRYSMDA